MRLAPITLFLTVGTATVWLAYLQNEVVYPPPENLIQQARRKSSPRVRPPVANRANAKLTLYGPNSAVRLTDPGKLVIEFENISSEEFYITTHTNVSTSGDIAPRNFRLITDDVCPGRVHTIFDTFIEWSEQDWLANRAIRLLHLRENVSLQMNLATWADVFCTPGKHNVRVAYDGFSPDRNFSHPFLAIPLRSTVVQVTFEP
jgi:hypothetical protein